MLNVNGINWRVFLCSPFHPILMRDNGTYTLGVCDNNTHCIYIREDLDLEQLWDVLVHEIVHCTLFSYGFDLDRVCYEEMIAGFIERYGEQIISNAKLIYNYII